MLESNRFVNGRLAKGELAKRADAHTVLLNALADKENSYRRWMRPADIIAQNMNERPKPKPVAFAAGLTERLREFLHRDFRRRTPAGLTLVRFFIAARRKAGALFHTQQLQGQELHSQER
jgi:hypothetical protein